MIEFLHWVGSGLSWGVFGLHICIICICTKDIGLETRVEWLISTSQRVNTDGSNTITLIR